MTSYQMSYKKSVKSASECFISTLIAPRCSSIPNGKIDSRHSLFRPSLSQYLGMPLARAFGAGLWLLVTHYMYIVYSSQPGNAAPLEVTSD